MEELKRKAIAEELNSYALSCKTNRDFVSSEIALNRAIAMSPSAGVLWNNLGAVLWNLNRWDEAERAFKKALNYGYRNDTSLSNYGLLLSSMGEWHRAESMFNQAYDFNPDNKTSKWENSLQLLDQGKWTEGFAEYDVRRQIKREMTPLNYPMWNGECLNGKTIYINAEQGFGDRMLFSRYIHWVAKTWGCRVLLLDDPKLHNLFWELKKECNIEFIPDRVPWPDADFGQYLMNLPGIHGTTPDNVYPDPGLIRKRAAQHECRIPEPQLQNTLKVGICWTGNPEMDQNAQRSIPFELLLTLAENPDVLLYSFQVGNGTEEISRLGATGLVVDLEPELKKEGWVGTASALLRMDLVVTCCTSIAHLAGALNVPTWVALCKAPYWVWLRDREDSVWYPNHRLYRQDQPGQWLPTINNLKSDLQKLTNKKKEPDSWQTQILRPTQGVPSSGV